MSPIIEVEALTKRYKNSESNAVDGISFTANTGEFFTLLGPNGAGKTTTISILTTTLTPTSGTARIGGFDLVQEASLVRRQVGIIFQKPSLDLNLTAEENVRFHAVMYGLYPFRPTFSLMPRRYKHQIEELSQMLGLSDEIFKPIKTFSGGMKRKLEIIRSLIHQPKVLFLDEPTVGLDPASRRNLWEYIKRVRRESGTTVFLTTHYLDEAEEADTVCIISKGQIVAFGTPEQVKARLIERYLLIDAADREALRQELGRLAIPYEEAGLIKINLNGSGSAHRVLKAIDTPLTTVQTHNPSLEDAYLAIVEETQ
ncbi:MAG TPA: ABC transporter ATP-binding protein [Anaerolineae bacterium]|nr:ABC transporter ATP-binding protein [Anaerolineae bacterium]